MKSDIIIIGGGAAGLMAAYGAATARTKADDGTMIEIRASVTVLEKMPRPGRKIMITGKGRCNFSNVKPWEEFSKHIRSKAAFVRPAFYNLPPERMLDFVERYGTDTVIERGDRAFPVSHKASSIVDSLTRAAMSAGVRIETSVEVKAITCNESSDGPVFMISTSGSRTYSCRKLIIATGGLSYPTTGSSGDGYGWARQFGHSIRECFPSLTAIVPKGYKDNAPKGHINRALPLSETGKLLCGNSLKNVGLTLFLNGNEIQHEFGDLDFTDGGIEGPIGFEISRNCVKGIINGGKAAVSIDLKPGVPAEDLKKRIKELWDGIYKDPRSKRLSHKEMLKILLGKLMPWEMIPGFLKTCDGIMSGKKGYERIDLFRLADCLHDWKFEIDGYVGYERCVVTAGGVAVEEVLPKTMESRLRSGLYFCGEMLDIDADTGGYNLQLAFSTGFLAGQSASLRLQADTHED